MELSSEMIIHLGGLQNLNKSGVVLFEDFGLRQLRLFAVYGF